MKGNRRKRPPYNLTLDEIEFIFKHGYTIREKWISLVERWEFSIYRMGGENLLAIRKSPRAAYNFIVRRVTGNEEK